MGMIWRPDTCECVIEYVSTNEDADFQQVNNHCSEHQGLTGVEIHAAVLAENRLKNVSVNEVAKLTGASPEEIKYTFDPQRKLSIEAPKGSKKEDLQSALDEKLGSNKVKVEDEKEVKP